MVKEVVAILAVIGRIIGAAYTARAAHLLGFPK
jgi:hypothetical protein